MATIHQLTTPRAAGLAGVLFAVLFAISIVLIRTSLPEDAAPGSVWLAGAEGRLRWAAILMPFAGIAFLWFIGVVRDGFGRFEDRFFASVFLGSGLLFLAMMFVATTAGVALLATRGIGTPESDLAIKAFGSMFVTTLSKTYAVRMASVFMISLATIWLKTGLMPRWLIVSTYLVAVVLLVTAEVSPWLTLVFPAWVLVVSLLALVRSGVIDLHHED